MTENTLHKETSPYLLQHADNPVHWRAWGPEALELARDQSRPVLLSVGYAACHWCHVMAHESFEDHDTATLMNELFVNIKVDREERPDIDAIYQHALMITGQQGGWPLTMFLTPDGEPFWGGTYFPPDSRYGRPGFPDVLRAIAEFYRANPDKVAEAVDSLRSNLATLSQSQAGGMMALDFNDEAARRLTREFDMVNGGIGGAPKFPNPSILDLVWRAWRRIGDTDCRDAVLLALDKMSQGGIYDHLGGGYARYSTDEIWLAPHFEKMLYDNAQLIDLLTAAWQSTRNPLYEQRVTETVDWIFREMIADGGGFAATLDADSEGEEGKFYVWGEAEIDQILDRDAALFKTAYDVTANGNWEHKNILNRNHGAGPFDADQEKILTRCRATLLDARAKRIRPGWDDKVLADWNGLMIAALANAGAVFERPDWIGAARTAFKFVIETMAENGRLFHSWRNGRALHAATLDDYANMCRGALALYEATGWDHALAQARGWIEILDRHYLDLANGGYFFTADDAEALIVRRKSAADNATPAGNGVIADVLAKLYFLTGDDAYRKRAAETITAFSGEAAQNFFPLATLLNASETLQRTFQIVIVGARGEDDDTKSMVRAANDAAPPSRLITVVEPEDTLPPGHPAAGKGQIDGRVTAYVCTGETCSLPVTEPAKLIEMFGSP